MNTDKTVTVTDDGADHLTYARTSPERTLRVYKGNLVYAGFVARDWHGGQWSALYSLGCGNFDYETVCDASRELARALERIDTDADIEDAQMAQQYLDEVAHSPELAGLR